MNVSHTYPYYLDHERDKDFRLIATITKSTTPKSWWKFDACGLLKTLLRQHESRGSAMADEKPTESQTRPIAAAARRALEEAEERRVGQPSSANGAVEVAGREGLDPVRYGDWEVKGLASDF